MSLTHSLSILVVFKMQHAFVIIMTILHELSVYFPSGEIWLQWYCTKNIKKGCGKFVGV
jgi:hypothetical protein